MSSDTYGYVYLIGKSKDKSDSPRNPYKVGFTRSKDPIRRLRQLQTASEVELYMVHSFHTKYFTQIEKMLHRHYKTNSLSGEWVSLTGAEARSFPDLCVEMEKRIKFLEEHNTYYQDKKT